MKNLDDRIKATKKLLHDYDMMPHDPDPSELIMKNQIAIMETLKDIQDEIKKPPSARVEIG